ncbi:MAG TPA: NAD-dependent epimerase/dehydratase family protein [Pirellulales bacterium]|jgi:nucleoside-diphosphate-sugar epimerase|nr:NAD-dependent epimerase/dehydratase family protein [Pirellulales bacterium]
MTRVLVTGANGFIGGQLVSALLSRGDDVRCLIHNSSTAESLQKLGAKVTVGDVTVAETLPAAIDGVEIVYHLAGLTKAFGLEAFCRVNQAGVRNLIEGCLRRTTPPVLVLVSSLAAAGPMSTGNQLRTERDLPQPISHYGLSKRAGELVAESHAANLPITIVRPPIVLGPGDHIGVAMFRGIRRMRSFVMLGLGRRFSVVHVADLATGLMAAAARGERLPAQTHLDGSSGRGYYFIADDQHPTIAELARIIARSINCPRAWAIPLPLATTWPLGAVGELIGHITRRPRYLNWDRAREITGDHWTCSPEKARRELGFAPAASLTERIQQTTRWYRKHGWL